MVKCLRCRVKTIVDQLINANCKMFTQSKKLKIFLHKSFPGCSNYILLHQFINFIHVPILQEDATPQLQCSGQHAGSTI